MENRFDNYDVYDYEVLDVNGRKLGKITGLWVDEATGKPEFASIKTGWIVGKNHMIPIRDAFFDYGGHMLRVPYEEARIRDAPSFAPDQTLSNADEDRIYQHYRLDRSLARSPTGLPGTRRGVGATGGQARELTGTEEIPLHEERVNVGKRDVGETVRLRKIVRTEAKKVPIELTRERVEIERIPASQMRGTYSGRAFQEEEFTMRERREEPVVSKTREVVGGVRATKDTDVRRETVDADVRREDVEIDRNDRERTLGRRSDLRED